MLLFESFRVGNLGASGKASDSVAGIFTGDLLSSNLDLDTGHKAMSTEINLDERHHGIHLRE